MVSIWAGDSTPGSLASDCMRPEGSPEENKGAARCPIEIDPAQLVNREVIIALSLLGLVALLPVAFRLLRKSPA